MASDEFEIENSTCEIHRKRKDSVHDICAKRLSSYALLCIKPNVAALCMNFKLRTFCISLCKIQTSKLGTNFQFLVYHVALYLCSLS